MSRTPKRPANVVVEPVHARAIRGPHRDGSARWYWRAEVYQGGKGTGRTIWTGWALRTEVGPILIDQIAEHGLDQPEPEASPVETVRDLMEHWVAKQEGRADVVRSTRGNARLTGKRICDAIGEVRLDRVNVDTVDTYRDTQLRAGKATQTIASDLKRFRAAWKWGRQLGLVPNTDMPRATIKIVPVRDKRTPTPDEILQVLDHLTGWPRLLVVVLYATGARLSEGSGLTWADVDLGAALVRFRKTKTGVPRDVPIGPDVVAELRAARPDPVDLSAGIYGRAFSTARYEVGGYLTRACGLAGVVPFSPQGLRRAAVDSMADAGVDVGTAASFTGHSPAVMFKYYRQATEAGRRSAVEKAGLGRLVRFPKGGKRGKGGE